GDHRPLHASVHTAVGLRCPLVADVHPGLDAGRRAGPSARESQLLRSDSSVSETYGQQEGSAYNGHFASIHVKLFL
ncbi:hypothetical protein LCGC14_1651310, partial [marine sediment metagenome]